MDNDLSGEMRKIKIKLTPNEKDSSVEVDFYGTTMQLESNYNAPLPVTRAAVLYAFRILTGGNIPMNSGIMKPIKIKIPRATHILSHGPRLLLQKLGMAWLLCQRSGDGRFALGRPAPEQTISLVMPLASLAFPRLMARLLCQRSGDGRFALASSWGWPGKFARGLMIRPSEDNFVILNHALFLSR